MPGQDIFAGPFDIVGIQIPICLTNLKSRYYLNGWNPFWSWWDACEIKTSKFVIVASHHPLTLVNLEKITINL